MKKNKIVILVISIIVITLIVLLCVLLKKEKYVFDSENFYEAFDQRYYELELRRLDKENVLSYFGMEYSDDEETLFMTDFIETEEEYIFNPNELIILVDEKKNKEYYDYLRQFIEMQIMHLDDKDKIKLYSEAILEKNGKVIYFIMSKEQDRIKEFIKNYFA